MFTGIVRARGRVVDTGDGRIVVECPVDAGIGDSVSVAGVCLTVVDASDGRLAFQLSPETLRRTTLERVRPGDDVNVEPALRVGEPFGGHFVQGHVDGVGRVRSHEPEGEGTRMWIEAPRELLGYCVEKGSIAVDGVSLTIAELAGDAFAVALVPHTLAATTLGERRPGHDVNLEVDVLAKYVARLVGQR